ncbi:hypothetical protein A2774_01150 [Candidatus Roizmanbacteria bacterium RIFCSPHIGHO2_01_FULL_39_12c]|uniref:Antitoxin n=1 Tax=Candidatus Roizmanbacteria bacterium RIFCSPHIGHO2_01_FULL_39_12c TaxID=1802031 RepID=A0A1F7G8E3_9BACT|nr:MAG: hypothetical protein A2774_01150 [Candidatus Roizmanbacteria bacterium RIFCSPHIGHO2_01_FULL_39_12c]OGK46436.1 MAG: hypothetical protein A2963_01555 [Candidatus Roizmanbacteria bacterium RIFCSPLOWO2_01_FULL_40_13]
MKKPNKSIFTNREKEAKFWEKNYKETWEKGKSTGIEFAKNLSATINIRLEPEVLDKIKGEAHKKGLGPTQLIRMWIMEKVHQSHTGI